MESLTNQIKQLNKHDALPINDAISLSAVHELVESGNAKIINNLIILTKSGQKAALLAYCGKKKWLKKEKSGKSTSKAKRSIHQKVKKLDTENDY